MLKTICSGLSSVLDSTDILQFNHQSFVDFLVDPRECPPEFQITARPRPEEGQHLIDTYLRRKLIDACLRTVSTKLRFNICGLESSMLFNAEVPDIEEKVKENIPPRLSYSCCFWADHLSDLLFDKGLIQAVKEVIKDKFLYWLEVMSLLGEVNCVVPILRVVLQWSKVCISAKYLTS